MSAPAPSTRAPVPEADAVRLSAYLDGELTAEERDALERRLAAEESLRKELEALRASKGLVRAVEVEAVAGGRAPSSAFATFGSRLSMAAPDEMPVAPALRPPRLRRVLTVAAAGSFGLVLLGIAGGILENFSGPPPCGWQVGKQNGKSTILREGRAVRSNEWQRLHLKDRFCLEAGSPAEFQGPWGLHATLSGPAALVFEEDFGLYLEFGKLELNAEARDLPSEWSDDIPFSVRTPDGSLKPRPKDGLRFEVSVERRETPRSTP